MNFVKIKKLAFLLAGVALFNACEKAESTDQLADKGQQIIRIADYGGLTNFGPSTLVLDASSTSEVFEFRLEFLGYKVFENDVTVTVGVDDAALTAYNASVPAGERYLPLPASMYTLNTTTAVIKAGEVFSTPISITFNPSLFDPSKSYMIPISIISISGAPAGVVKAPGTGTAFFHIIGNPLAGNYTMTGVRYNYTGTVAWAGPPAPIPANYTPPTTIYSGTIFATPLSALTVTLDMGNVPDPAGGLAQYYVSGTDLTFDNIEYNFTPTFNAGYSNIRRYIVSYTKPAPGVPASFHLITHYNNAAGGAGSDRIIDQTFVHQ